MHAMAPQAFIDLATNDPLFAAEGMDLERGLAALEGIEAVAAETENVISGVSWKARLFLTRYRLTTHALPIPFVRAFIESERALRRFLAYPTLKSGKQLLRAWEHAQHALERSIERYVKLHELLYFTEKEEAQSRIFDMHATITMPDDADAALKLLRENAKKLGAEIRERRSILMGADTEAVSPPAPAAELLYIPGHIPQKYLRLHELELEHSLPFRDGEILERFGPLQYSLPHFEGENTEHQFMVYIVRTRLTGLVSLKICAVDVYLFATLGESVAHVAQASSANNSLTAQGLRYWYQPSTNLYALRDQSYWADIATIVDMRRRPLHGARVLRQKSSLFDCMLGACLQDHEMNFSNVKEIVRTTGRIPRPWRLLLFRTHPSIYYLPFNGSVWRLPQKPNFLGSIPAKPEERMHISADQLLTQVSPQEIEQIMQSGRIREEARRAASR